MSDQLQEIVAECRRQLAVGTATVEECVARYPAHAAELQGLLPLVRALDENDSLRPSPRFKARTRDQLLAHARSHPRRQKCVAFWSWLPFLGQRPYRPAYALASVLLICLLLATTAMAQAALPGQPLYGWKLVSERVWRAAQSDPVGAELALASRRVEEMVRVTGDATSEQQARAAYEKNLRQLAAYSDEPAIWAAIYTELSRQESRLSQQGLSVSLLDELLDVEPLELPPPPIEDATTPTVAPSVTRTSQPTPSPTVAPSLTVSPLPDLIPTVTSVATPELPAVMPTLTPPLTLPTPDTEVTVEVTLVPETTIAVPTVGASPVATLAVPTAATPTESPAGEMVPTLPVPTLPPVLP